MFLVKVHNEAGVTAELRAPAPTPNFPTAARPAAPTRSRRIEPQRSPRPLAGHRPCTTSSRSTKNLSGLELEYRIVQLYSRDAGKREAKLGFDVGQGTQDLGFRNEVDVLFDCEPSRRSEARGPRRRRQADDRPVRHPRRQGRVYPAMTRRLAPDFFFHDQIYRHNGETVLLPPGKYHVTYTRGPEYVTLKKR